MKLSNLKKVNDSDVRDFLKQRYELTPYQCQKMYNDEFPRFTEFYVFTYEKEKNQGLIWRLTLPFIIPYFLIIIMYVLLKWVVTGNRYFSEEKSLLKFHRKWMKKLGIDWM
jgi:hypothetical protein